MSEAVQILLPTGRLVQGHPMELNVVTDQKTKLPKLDKSGQPQKSVYIALAYPKSEGIFMSQVWPQLAAVAQRDWPGGQFNAPTFAWKVIDGDGRDKQGKPYADREGFAGCHVLKISSGYVYQVVDMPEKANVPIIDPNAIKRGYYLRAHVSVKGNNPSESPGLYINSNFAQLMGYGPVIVSGPDVAAILAASGGAPTNVPMGMTKTAPTPGVGALPAIPGATPAPAVGLPAIPGAMPAPTMPGALPMIGVPAAFPPAGWLPHPQSPGYYYSGQMVKSEAELRAAPLQPHPGILTPPQ